jgi:hypothetical protein
MNLKYYKTFRQSQFEIKNTRIHCYRFLNKKVIPYSTFITMLEHDWWFKVGPSYYLFNRYLGINIEKTFYP